MRGLITYLKRELERREVDRSYHWFRIEQGCETCGMASVEVNWDELTKDIDELVREFEAKRAAL